MQNLAFEKHYRVKDLASLWGLSRKTVTRVFAGEAGVVRVTNDGTSKYATLSISESAASRVHEKLGKQQLCETAEAIQSLKIIRLRHLDPTLSRNLSQYHQAETLRNERRTKGGRSNEP